MVIKRGRPESGRGRAESSGRRSESRGRPRPVTPPTPDGSDSEKSTPTTPVYTPSTSNAGSRQASRSRSRHPSQTSRSQSRGRTEHRPDSGSDPESTQVGIRTPSRSVSSRPSQGRNGSKPRRPDSANSGFSTAPTIANDEPRAPSRSGSKEPSKKSDTLKAPSGKSSDGSPSPPPARTRIPKYDPEQDDEDDDEPFDFNRSAEWEKDEEFTTPDCGCCHRPSCSWLCCGQTSCFPPNSRRARLMRWLRKYCAYPVPLLVGGGMIALAGTGPITKFWFCEVKGVQLGGMGYCYG